MLHLGGGEWRGNGQRLFDGDFDLVRSQVPARFGFGFGVALTDGTGDACSGSM